MFRNRWVFFKVFLEEFAEFFVEGNHSKICQSRILQMIRQSPWSFLQVFNKKRNKRSYLEVTKILRKIMWHCTETLATIQPRTLWDILQVCCQEKINHHVISSYRESSWTSLLSDVDPTRTLPRILFRKPPIHRRPRAKSTGGFANESTKITQLDVPHNT